MFQPSTLALVLALLVGAAARAQTAPVRAELHRSVTVTGKPADPLPEIHVAKGTATMILFPVQIRKKPLTVDASRICVVDVGEHSIIVEPVEDLRADERQEIGVLFADGRAPEGARFVLASRPSDVDTRIDVVRREQPEAACQAEVKELRARLSEIRPETFVLLGFVDKGGVPTASVDAARDAVRGLQSGAGVAYRGKGWVLVEVVITNLEGAPPWTPSEATLTGNGETLRARLVTQEKGEIAPGDTVRVLVVSDEPPTSAGPFTLEVRGVDGRSLAIPKVRFPANKQEGTR